MDPAPQIFPRRILVVEDNDDMAVLLRDFLRKQGYSIATAASSREALATISSGVVPDLVIADVMMAGGSGIDLTKRLLEMTPAMPVVLISAFDTPEVIKEVKASGARQFLAKPFPLAGLARVVKEEIC